MSASGGAGLDGFLPISKPAGPTSHDVVLLARSRVPGGKVGHAGTLDPAAEGVLVLAFGRATQRVASLQACDKSYEAVVRFGVTTDTDDLAGKVVAEAPAVEPESGMLEGWLSRLRGEIVQRAPAVSALKHRGESFHAIVRRGGEPPVRERPVVVRRLETTHVAWPEVSLSIECSGGTYVRSIARDLGEMAGCGAALARLVRTRVGPYGLETCWTLEQLRAAEAEAIVAALHSGPHEAAA